MTTTDLAQQLVSTIDPKNLTLADWMAIAKTQNYQISWVFRMWIKAKGVKFLKSVDIDSWIVIANFLGYRPNWATERYMEYKNAADEEEVEVA